MAPWNLRPAHDPLTVVEGVAGATYPCPDLPTLDAHLSELSARLRDATPAFPDLAHSFRTEIDRLLDRRIYLEWAATASPCAGAA